jgi:hypothetical protein
MVTTIDVDHVCGGFGFRAAAPRWWWLRMAIVIDPTAVLWLRSSGHKVCGAGLASVCNREVVSTGVAVARLCNRYKDDNG